MDPDRLAELLSDGPALIDDPTTSSDDLAQLRAELIEAAQALAAGLSAADDPAAVAEQVEALAAQVRAIDDRVAARTGAQDRVTAALAALQEPGPEPDPEPEPTPAPEPPPPPVTAAALVRPRPSAPEPPAPAARAVSLVAAAGLDFTQGGGVVSGAPFRTVRELSMAMEAAHSRLSPNPDRTARAVVARVARAPRPVVLGDDGEANLVALEDVGRRYAAGDISLTAAAGPFCAPAEVVYDYFDMTPGGLWSLPTVDSPRGRRSYPDSPTLADITGDWLAVIGSQTDPKPCFVVTCGTDETFSVVSYPTCLRFDNFTGRFYPERVAMIGRQTLRYHEFVLQAALLAAAQAMAENLNVQDSGGGFVIALVRALRHAAAWFRNKYYLPTTTRLEVLLPAWVPSAIAVDIVSRDATLDLAVVEDRVRSILTADNITIQWINGWQMLPKAGWDTLANGIEALMYLPGSIIRLDGGTLDLGVQRDTTRNAANQFDTFFEEWAGLARPGPAPLRITGIPVCTSGGTGDREVITCGAGS